MKEFNRQTKEAFIMEPLLYYHRNSNPHVPTSLVEAVEEKNRLNLENFKNISKNYPVLKFAQFRKMQFASLMGHH